MFFTQYSNIGIGQKYRYYIGRYRYQQKWPISANTDTDTDIGSTLPSEVTHALSRVSIESDEKKLIKGGL